MPPDSFGVDILQAIGLIALLPFLGWGVYGLDHRYRRRCEWPLSIEAVTILAVLLFVAFEMTLLRPWMRDQIIYYIFAVLGLFLSCAALYAHTAISLTSRIVVDFVTSGEDDAPDKPRFGPAEILEHQKDYEGALQEYLVLARIYPHQPAVHLRVAETLLRLSRPEEAVQWLNKALCHLPTDESALPVVSRLCEVNERMLNAPEQARGALTAFLERFPQSKHAEALRQRRDRVGHPETHEVAPELVALGDVPLSEPGDLLKTDVASRREAPPTPIAITPLQEMAITSPAAETQPESLTAPPPPSGKKGSRNGLDRM